MKRIDYSNEDIYLYLFLKAFILELLCMLSIRNCSREKVKKKKDYFSFFLTQLQIDRALVWPITTMPRL